MIDPERQKRVVDQTIERYKKDEQFKAQVNQTLVAALAPSKTLAITNVALMIAQAEQMAREEVLAELISHDESLAMIEPPAAADSEPTSTWGLST